MGKKEVFTVGEKEYAVLTPGAGLIKEAQLEFVKTMTQSIKDGVMVKKALDSFLEEQGLWSKEHDKQEKEINKEIAECLRKLNDGEIEEFEEAVKVAKRVKELRAELLELRTDRNELDLYTAEGLGESARFNYFAAKCIVDNTTGEPVYKDLDDYIEHVTDEVALQGTQILMNMVYGLTSDLEKRLPENKFLFEFGFVNDKLQYVNSDGHLVDREGNLIDEDGRYVDESGNFINVDGTPVDEQGIPQYHSRTFVDKDGNPVQPKHKLEELLSAET